MAEVSAHDVEELAAFDVCRTHQLAQVPLALAFTLDLFFGEVLNVVREVATKDDRGRPYVAQNVRREVGGERRWRADAGQ